MLIIINNDLSFLIIGYKLQVYKYRYLNLGINK